MQVVADNLPVGDGDGFSGVFECGLPQEYGFCADDLHGRIVKLSLPRLKFQIFGKSAIFTEFLLLNRRVVAAVLLMSCVGRILFPEVGEPKFGGSYEGQADGDDYSNGEGKNPSLPTYTSAVLFGKQRHCTQHTCNQHEDENHLNQRMGSQ